MRGGGWVGEAAGGWRRRGRGGASAPARVLARGGRMRANKWPWQLPWVLGEVSSCLLDGEGGWTSMLAATATMVGGSAACARGGARAAFL
jgi:hypothetical protein